MILQKKPFLLQNNQCLKEEFFDLAGRILTHVPKWEDSRIRPNMINIYSHTRPAQEAMNKFRNSIKRLKHEIKYKDFMNQKINGNKEENQNSIPDVIQSDFHEKLGITYVP